MAFWQGRDFLFCGVCGTLLTFNSIRSASCPLCGFKRSAKELEGKETRYSISDHDIRRDLKLEPFVTTVPILDVVVILPRINSDCPKCHHKEAKFYVKQLRSSDEGQTEFLECLGCGNTFRNNT